VGREKRTIEAPLRRGSERSAGHGLRRGAGLGCGVGVAPGAVLRHRAMAGVRVQSSIAWLLAGARLRPGVRRGRGARVLVARVRDKEREEREGQVGPVRKRERRGGEESGGGG
jgi:hypothetical protein